MNVESADRNSFTPMDTKSATSGWHYREITCTEFVPKGSKSVDHRGKITVTLLR